MKTNVKIKKSTDSASFQYKQRHNRVSIIATGKLFPMLITF